MSNSDIVSLVVASVSLMVAIIAVIISVSTHRRDVNKEILNSSTNCLYFMRSELINLKNKIGLPDFQQVVRDSEERTMDSLAKAKNCSYMYGRYYLYMQFNSEDQNSLNDEICQRSEDFKAVMNRLSTQAKPTITNAEVDKMTSQIDSTIIRIMEAVRSPRPHCECFWKRKVKASWEKE